MVLGFGVYMLASPNNNSYLCILALFASMICGFKGYFTEEQSTELIQNNLLGKFIKKQEIK